MFVVKSSINPNPSATEAVAIPQRNDRNDAQNALKNQSVGSTTSSTDRYSY